MTTIATALTSLGIKKWVLQGEPTTETEFNAMFRKVTGSKNGSPIEISDPIIMRGLAMVQVSLTPFQYNPITKDLTIMKTLLKI